MTRRTNRALAWGAAAVLATGAAAGAVALAGPGGPQDPRFDPIGTYSTGIGLDSAETTAFAKGRLYVTNSEGNTLDVVDASDPAAPTLLNRIDLSPYGAAPNSVDVSGGLVAVAMESDPKTDPGRVAFFRRDGGFITTVAAGALPDMLTFTKGGRELLVANEGEPSGYGPGESDPEGTISIITTAGLSAQRPPRVRTIDFRAFDEGGPRHDELPADLRLNGPGARVSQDLEPEYITVSQDGRTAWVSLQEANALAQLDLHRARVTAIRSLGYKDHSVEGAGLDPSDRDGAIAIAPWPVRGLYMPDAIASFRVKGRDYVITANEGDARDLPGFADEARLGSGDVVLDPTAFPNAAALKDNAALGRLTISTTDGRGEDGEFEAIYSFGARSAAIWRGDGRLVWDSGDQMERRVAAEQPEHFNSNHEENNFDNRSDNKGPEPEGVAVGTIRGRTYAFVGLERQGGVMVFDVSRPDDARLIQWANNRDYAADPVGPDSGPEIIRFVPANDSPTRRPLVIVANEVSGTVTFYESSVR